MDVGEELDRLLFAGDWRAMDEFLQGLDEAGLAEARRAFSGPPGWEECHSRLPDQRDHYAYHRALRVACVTLLDEPKAALSGTGWVQAWNAFDDWEIEGVLLERIAARGRRWATGFVAAAVEESPVVRDDLYPFCRSLILHLGLPLPAGRGYREEWSATLTNQYFLPPNERALQFVGCQREWELDDRGRRTAIPPTRDLPVVDRMRREPHLRQLVRDSLDTKKGIHRWHPDLPHPVQAVLVELVAEGLLDRDDLVAGAWSVLGRVETPSAHLAAVDLLLRLLDTDQLTASFPMLLGVLGSVHGSVTSVLLPAALQAASADEDLAALCDVVFARPEKKQRHTLLAALTADTAPARWSHTTLASCLATAAAVDDLKLAKAALAALTTYAVVPEPVAVAAAVPMTGLWRAEDPRPVESPAFTWLPTGESVLAAINYLRGRQGRDAAVHTALLAVIVRGMHKRPDEGRPAFRQLTGEAPARDAEPRLDFWGLVRQWAWVGLLPDWRSSMRTRIHEYFDEPGQLEQIVRGAAYDSPAYRATECRSPVDGFMALLSQEALGRAGSIPYLLSTPSRADGTLRFGDLVARLRGYDGFSVGPMDLFQALLRLDPVEAGGLGPLDGLRLPLWDDEGDQPPGDGLDDAVEVVRRWVREGGCPTAEVDFSSGHPRLQPLAWPPVVRAFPQLPQGLLARLSWLEAQDHEAQGFWLSRSRLVNLSEAVLAFPHLPDLVALYAEPTMVDVYDRETTTRWVLAAAGRATAGVHHVMVFGLNAKKLERRLEGVDAALTLIGSGRWEAQVHADVTVAYLRAGHLGLARSTSAWEQLALAGELRAVWPTVMAVLEAGALLPRKPAGYAEVVAFARTYVAAVPDPEIPSAVVDLAAARGSTRSHLEARALVEAAR